MMKLKSLQIIPRGKNGWGSDKLIFAKSITQLYGPNGTGKTPLIKSLAYCLGYPSIFRDDIFTNCGSAILTISIEDNIYRLERKFQNDFDLTVHEPMKTKQNFYKESDYSKYLFELLGYDFPHLVNVRNEATHPYLSTLLPVFYLDQDNGYDDFYKAPSNFIRDQFDEMVRICARFPAKNSFDKKKHSINAKGIVERARKKVYRIKNLYEQMLDDTEISTLLLEDIDKQIIILKEEINRVKTSENIIIDATSTIDKLISLKMQQARNVKDELTTLEKKCLSIDSVQAEIEVEINTLSLNEESRRVFMSFSDICSVQGCGLFVGSNESYGKNLLYLKDQIKDLVISSESAKVQLDALNSTLNTYLEDIEILNNERVKALEENELDVFVESIHKSLSEIIDLEIKKQEKESIIDLEDKYMKAEEELNHAINKLEALSSAPNSSSLDLIRFKSNLKASIINWLDIIKTKNISTRIDLVDGFKPNYGTEKLKQLSGSTHLRAVLSFHAALFEQIIQCNQYGMKFLVLDTPGQHDISVDDLDLYIASLKELADEYEVQVIFSTTRYKYESSDNDINWLPTYTDDGFEQTMFLGQV